jgi:hypothetical protein
MDTLNKQEALDVIKEIQNALGAYITVTCVSLDPQQVNGKVVGYGIRMKCGLDNISRGCLKPILDKHNLVLEEKRGYIIISARKMFTTNY